MLLLPALTSVVGGSASGSGVRIWTVAGGHLTLAKLTSVHSPASIEANGAGSDVNVSMLTSFVFPKNGFASGVFELSGGVIQIPPGV